MSGEPSAEVIGLAPLCNELDVVTILEGENFLERLVAGALSTSQLLCACFDIIKCLQLLFLCNICGLLGGFGLLVLIGRQQWHNSGQTRFFALIFNHLGRDDDVGAVAISSLVVTEYVELLLRRTCLLGWGIAALKVSDDVCCEGHLADQPLEVPCHIPLQSVLLFFVTVHQSHDVLFVGLFEVILGEVLVGAGLKVWPRLALRLRLGLEQLLLVGSMLANQLLPESLLRVGLLCLGTRPGLLVEVDDDVCLEPGEIQEKLVGRADQIAFKAFNFIDLL